MAFSVRMSREENASISCKDWWNKGRFMDITLFCENEAVEAHKLILASQSGYFNRILGSIPQNAYGPVSLVALPMPSKKLLKGILEYLYCGEVDISPEDMEDFIELGRFLEIPSFIGLNGDLIESIQSRKLSSAPATSCETVGVNLPGVVPIDYCGVTMEEEEFADGTADSAVFEEGDVKVVLSDIGDAEVLQNDDPLEQQPLVLVHGEGVDYDEVRNENEMDVEEQQGPALMPPGLDKSAPLEKIGCSTWMGRQENTKGAGQGVRPFLKLYFCGICGVPSRSRQKALYHERTHTGDRPIKCDMCVATFKQPSHLKTHYLLLHKEHQPSQAMKNQPAADAVEISE